MYRAILKRVSAIAAILAVTLLPLGCGDEGDNITNNNFNTSGPTAPAAGSILALTDTQILLNVAVSAPGTVLFARPLVGVRSGETIVAIDYRPLDKQLYGYSDGGHLYRIDPLTGVALQVGTSAFLFPGATDYGFDFSPVADRIRLVTEDDINVRVDPTDASLSTDTALAFDAGDPNSAANPALIAVAYSNNVAGASTTTLYGIEQSLGILVRIDPPDAGRVHTIGALGVTTTTDASFDIAPGGTAYAAIELTPGLEGLYTIDLATGEATLVATIGTGTTINGIAVVP